MILTGKAALAPFGDLTETYLSQWLSEYKPNANLWGLIQWGYYKEYTFTLFMGG